MMKEIKGEIISINGDFAIYKNIKPVMGGHYSVVNLKDRTAKSGLCLDAAIDVFKKLTQIP